MQDLRRAEDDRNDVNEPAERKVDVDEDYDDQEEDVKRGSVVEKLHSPNGVRDTNGVKPVDGRSN